MWPRGQIGLLPIRAIHRRIGPERIAHPQASALRAGIPKPAQSRHGESCRHAPGHAPQFNIPPVTGIGRVPAVLKHL